MIIYFIAIIRIGENWICVLFLFELQQQLLSFKLLENYKVKFYCEKYLETSKQHLVKGH